MGRYFGRRSIDEPRAVTLEAGGLAAAGLDTMTGPLGSVVVRDELVERARRGDERAFGALVAPCIEPAFRRALAILGNESDARDAVQDALLDAWRGIHALRDSGRFDAWLGRIVMNACRAAGRRRGRSRVREIRIDLLDDRYPGRGAGATTDDQDGGLDELERAFERLPLPQRAILVLHHLEHRSVAEIAATLGVPAGTVMWRLHRARAALAHALEEERR
ncbi:MAG TPA: sigma-70 family RNA polymerase sigma factor [Candidatus Dormibacteraeota bacterium]|nr:sigma-70 family RNA polymerase sigma factor [Candidatus Dormibacteraeota bacterium]